MRQLCISAVLLCILCSSVFAAFSDPIWSSQACRTRNDTGTPPGSQNNHDSSKLTVRADNPADPGAFAQKSWIRFDLTGVDMTGVRGATLTLTLLEARYDETTLEVSAVNDDCHDNDSWTDTNLTWNNAPGNDIASFTSLDAAKTTLISNLSFPGGAIGQAFDIDVFSVIQADTDGNVQFVLHNGNANINFCTWDYSIEAYRPYLTLEYIPAGADSPDPAIGATVTSGLSSLSWVIPDPNNTGTIYCDVYLGTDPNRPQMNKKTLAANVNTVDINTTNFPTFGTLIDNTKYYWFVDIHDAGRLPNPIPGEEWSFTVDDNLAPVIEEIVGGADQILWGTFPYVATLDAVVSDDGLPTPPALTYLWEQIAGPATAVIDSPNTEDTTVTIAEKGDYRFRLTVSDGQKSTQAAQQIVVGDDACDASHIDTGADYNVADQNEDCIVDLEDFMVLIARDWLNETDWRAN